MCGINGIIQFSGRRTPEELRALVHAMNEQIVHRGPNHEGLYADAHCAIGMRRLSIIDLAGGLQPIWNETRTMAIVFNGEIYNFQSVRERLVSCGHHFATSSDTEVILHGYEEWGLEVLPKLEGMFAFAIYDQAKRQWLLARDRIGEKPLYYHHNGQCLVFGSELKSLLATGLVLREIDAAALSTYFQLTYIPAPQTIFQNVHKLLPATAMTIDAQGEVKTHSYWELPRNLEENLISDYGECKRQLREAMCRSVEQRLVSDVPLGAFLSGGFDSSIVVGIMAEVAGKQINTFTIGFPDKQHDETALAQLVAKRHNTNHTILKLDWETVLENIDHLLGNIDEPFADSSLISTYAVSLMAKKHVTVVLTGDAGDELFAGYNKYLANYYSDLYRKIPRFLRKNLLEKLFDCMPQTGYLVNKIKKVLRSADLTEYDRIVFMMSLGFKPDELAQLLPELPIVPMDFLQSQYEYFTSGDHQTRTQYVDLKTVLEGDMLPKVDRASMLASLETRVPLLDSKVVELAYRIPTRYKIARRERKIIWKDTFRDLLPPELFQAPKHGFGVPMEQFLRTVFHERLHHYASADFLEAQGLFDSAFIQEMIRRHDLKQENRFSELWAFFVFQNWYDRTMKQVRNTPPPNLNSTSS